MCKDSILAAAENVIHQVNRKIMVASFIASFSKFCDKLWVDFCHNTGKNLLVEVLL